MTAALSALVETPIGAVRMTLPASLEERRALCLDVMSAAETIGPEMQPSGPIEPWHLFDGPVGDAIESLRGLAERVCTDPRTGLPAVATVRALELAALCELMTSGLNQIVVTFTEEHRSC